MHLYVCMADCSVNEIEEVTGAYPHALCTVDQSRILSLCRWIRGIEPVHHRLPALSVSVTAAACNNRLREQSFTSLSLMSTQNGFKRRARAGSVKETLDAIETDPSHHLAGPFRPQTPLRPEPSRRPSWKQAVSEASRNGL
ncbi:hypothetical protein NEOLEDRAFT_872949 [Neolentinus lepideus HHB14362 ss-1]|uniref:Uncharacterized protein n=1 Tax=Neolentinus lepideus HHB14362 ss-1 TaxID=1314782 RepID=A0A165P0M8_9AGAM|nr:hypothetical protein NEOLEDRAFT_872949 [Neolentinus lepideus HHB14362 ss-1]